MIEIENVRFDLGVYKESINKLTDFNRVDSIEQNTNIVGLSQLDIDTFAGHCDYAQCVFRVLVNLHITNVCGSILLTIPARWCKVTVSVVFRIVQAIYK